jgi:GxxExxY protein
MEALSACRPKALQATPPPGAPGTWSRVRTSKCSVRPRVASHSRVQGFHFEKPLRLDLLVDDVLIRELKSVVRVLPIHKAQLLTYMKLLNKPVGLLINFDERILATESTACCFSTRNIRKRAIKFDLFVIFVVFYANPVLIIWRTVTNVLIEKARCLLQSWFYDAAG